MNTDTGGQDMGRYVWPAVAAFGMALAAVVAILLWGPDSSAASNAVVAILALLGTTVSSLVVLAKVYALHGDVSAQAEAITDVREKVNGRMTQLIAAKTITEPGDPAATETP